MELSSRALHNLQQELSEQIELYERHVFRFRCHVGACNTTDDPAHVSLPPLAPTIKTSPPRLATTSQRPPARAPSPPLTPARPLARPRTPHPPAYARAPTPYSLGTQSWNAFQHDAEQSRMSHSTQWRISFVWGCFAGRASPRWPAATQL